MKTDPEVDRKAQESVTRLKRNLELMVSNAKKRQKDIEEEFANLRD